MKIYRLKKILPLMDSSFKVNDLFFRDTDHHFYHFPTLNQVDKVEFDKHPDVFEDVSPDRFHIMSFSYTSTSPIETNKYIFDLDITTDLYDLDITTDLYKCIEIFNKFAIQEFLFRGDCLMSGDDKIKIHSVAPIPNGEVFKVGDSVSCEFFYMNNNIIEGFRFDENFQLIITFENGEHGNFNLMVERGMNVDREVDFDNDFKAVYNIFTKELAIKYGGEIQTFEFDEWDDCAEFWHPIQENYYLHVEIDYDEVFKLTFYPRNRRSENFNEEYSSVVESIDSGFEKDDNIKVVFTSEEYRREVLSL